jgi:protein-L-isoaspartate(D-aspartate) O-methyltransferase
MKFRAARQNMVDSQVRPNGVTDRRVIDAMLAVPRERFVPENRQDLAYADEDVALQAGQHGRCLLAPMTFGRMLQLAAVEPDDKVLIVGAGTGYGAAVIARLAAHVVALEQDEDLLRTARANLESLLNVTISQGELAAGHAVAAPYDVVLLEGRAEEAPQTLLAQLADGGRLVAPVGHAMLASLRLAVRRDGSLSWQRGADCSACELPGFRVKAPEFVF